MPTLAIVIPAYKATFLSKTLDSLAQQTNQNFTVYVGNDAGPKGIAEIVEGFKDRLNIHYHHFEDNIGGQSLVKQWERCLALIPNEEWIWLLPDDDYADPECVAHFYSHLQKDSFDLFRFNVHFVNADETIFKTNAALPVMQTAFDSLMEKLSFYRPSTIAEFIFRKEKFENIGFTEIPMAWGSDDLLWYQLGHDKGIHGCNDAYVYLRQSDLNISNNYTSLATRKIDANFIFFEKLINTINFKADVENIPKYNYFKQKASQHVMYNLQDFALKLTPGQMFKYSLKANTIWGGGILRNVRRFWLNNKRIDRFALVI